MRIGLIGYGEVGKILAGALVEQGAPWVGAYDRLLKDPLSAGPMEAHARKAGVQVAPTMAELLAESELVLSAVTASQTLAVATEAVESIRPATWFLDLNSASPGTKAECSRLIDAAGARYVESAVMTSVPPYGIRVPMLLGGPYAAAVRPLLASLGFGVEVAHERIGVASAIKMCRSVVIKGMEAIFIESLVTARHYGVEAQVLASLHETFPTLDWEEQASYFFSRVAQHGQRRAEEMREAAATVSEAGLDPHMAVAIAARQDWVAGLKEVARLGDLAKGANWRDYADRLRVASRKPGKDGSQ
jgi:3-hydroxyisobutyrate dehydrogenase-like beta-hydroxyacid dehydrogenase